MPKIEKQLKLLAEIGLDYLHLGESTPSLSGGEAQRLKLVNHLNKTQKETLFVFDEPSVGLHPRDVQTLLGVINQLKQKGATIIIITHDLDLMANADYMIDLGPKGGRCWRPTNGKRCTKGTSSTASKFNGLVFEATF